MIDKNDAETIAEKFGAVLDRSKKNRPHDLAVITYKGKRVAQFGIRRGSHKTGLGHGHIPGDLHWTQKKVKDCAACTLSKDDWIKDMIAQGVIVE